MSYEVTATISGLPVDAVATFDVSDEGIYLYGTSTPGCSSFFGGPVRCTLIGTGAPQVVKFTVIRISGSPVLTMRVASDQVDDADLSNNSVDLHLHRDSTDD
ncbi:hypothetical protein [Nocardioides daphniae]|uniref:Uncharacterized protein n=1 Tax=Nocardioides daphniae TaxID=402297 RepID=A0A4P7UG71_9ACTN|nr:hypothetical protein [Nocardioides daphniae]QCC77759.1 hypothetical protein E2C04_12215 [Nocardioides daphniae]